MYLQSEEMKLNHHGEHVDKRDDNFNDNKKVQKTGTTYARQCPSYISLYQTYLQLAVLANKEQIELRNQVKGKLVTMSYSDFENTQPIRRSESSTTTKKARLFTARPSFHYYCYVPVVGLKENFFRVHECF